MACRILLCEGGPTLLGALVRERLVDELFLTLAPRLVGGASGPGLYPVPPPTPGGTRSRRTGRRARARQHAVPTLPLRRGALEGSRRAPLEPEAADALLVPAEMVGELVAHGARDLLAQQLRVVTEVAHQRVAEDHDPVVEVVLGDRVALVEAVGAARPRPCAPRAAVGDDDRHVLERAVELEREIVDRRRGRAP